MQSSSARLDLDQRARAAAMLVGLGLAESLLLSAVYKNLRSLSLNVISAPLMWGGLLFLTGVGSLRLPLRLRGELTAMAAALGAVWAVFARQALRPEFVMEWEPVTQFTMMNSSEVAAGFAFVLAVFCWAAGALVSSATQRLAQSPSSNAGYALVLLGFALGAPAMYALDAALGHLPATSLAMLAPLVVLGLHAGRTRETALGLVVVVASAATAFGAVREGATRLCAPRPLDGGRHLGGDWSTYHRTDFWETSDGCVTGFYNGLMIWWTCPTPPAIGERLAAFPLEPDDRMLVIGVGGGHNLRQYLEVPGVEIDAVEIEPVAVEWFSGQLSAYNGGAFHDPRVRVWAREGRGFLRSVPDHTYDVIVLEGNDASTHLLQRTIAPIENYLYTRESWELALSKLAPDGFVVATFSEWSLAELPRVLAALPPTVSFATYRLTSDYRFQEYLPLTHLVVFDRSRAFRPPTDPDVVAVPVPDFDRSTVRALTDDQPFWGELSGIWRPAAAFFVGAGVLGVVIGLVLRTGVRRTGVCIVAGMLSTLWEMLVVSRGAGAFGNTAAGGVWLISLFLLGSLADNVLIHARGGRALRVLLPIGALGAAAFWFQAGSLPGAVAASLLALLVGVASGILWGFVLRATPATLTRRSYIVDILGGPPGAFLAFVIVPIAGFQDAAAIAAIGLGITWLLIPGLLRARA